MNADTGKPDGPRSKGCRWWRKDKIPYDYGDLHPNDKGWNEDDWSKFCSKRDTIASKSRRRLRLYPSKGHQSE